MIKHEANVRLAPGTHFVVMNKVEPHYRIEAEIEIDKIIELQRYTSIAEDRKLYKPIPVPDENAVQKFIAKFFVCFGCQTCWRMDAKGEIVDTGPHYLQVSDATAFMDLLHKAEVIDVGTFKTEEAADAHFAELRAEIASILRT